MAFVIAEPCVDVKDTACVKVCPVDCIYDLEGENQLYIHPTECIDCGACQPECPVQAIFPLSDVPAQWASYIEKNAKAFEGREIHASATGGGSDGVAAPAAPNELDAIRKLLEQVSAKKLAPEDALEQVVPALKKLGIHVD